MRCVEAAACLALALALGLAAGAARAQPPGTTLVYPPWSHCYGMHRVNQTHLTLRAGFRYKFADPQGMAALKLAAEDDTTTRRDDDELTVFGVNSGQHLLIYNTSLTAIAFYGREGGGPGEFRAPHGIGASRDGRVVVADTGNDRLHVLQYDSDALRHVRFIDGIFAGRPLRRPQGVAVERDEIFVCDPESDRVLVLDFEGRLQRELRPERDGAPRLQAPFAVAAIRADHPDNFFGEDFVVVTDSLHQRLVKLDRHGQMVEIRRVADTGGTGEFYYCAIDYHANVYVSDRGGRLHKFDRNLRFLLRIGRPGRGEYEFDSPRGIGLYRRFGQMFVAEREGAQYLWIGTDVFTPSVTDLKRDDRGRTRGVVRYFLTEYAITRLDFVDAQGAVRAALQPSLWTAPGPVVRPFELDADLDGTRLRVEALPTYSARRIVRVEKLSRPLRAPRAAGSAP